VHRSGKWLYLAMVGDHSTTVNIELSLIQQAGYYKTYHASWAINGL